MITKEIENGYGHTAMKKGLSSAQVEQSRVEHGSNELSRKKEKGLIFKS